MKNYTPLLECDNYYHIYNHAVGQENLFKNEGNYYYFLKKMAKYISPIADIYVYCLMPNHFHLLVKIKTEDELIKYFKELKGEDYLRKNLSGLEDLTGLKNELKNDLTGLVSKQFSNLFNSYTKSINKQQSRQGNLFRRPFKRLHIDSNDYFRELIHYIHFNPVHHGFVKDLRDWKHSSFESFFSEKATLLKRNEVIDWFDDKENFYAFHQKEINEELIINLEYID